MTYKTKALAGAAAFAVLPGLAGTAVAQQSRSMIQERSADAPIQLTLRGGYGSEATVWADGVSVTADYGSSRYGSVGVSVPLTRDGRLRSETEVGLVDVDTDLGSGNGYAAYTSLRLELPLTDRFAPYAAAGIGVAGDEEDAAFAWTARLGGAFRVTDRASVEAGYRLNAVKEDELTLGLHNVELGLSVGF